MNPEVIIDKVVRTTGGESVDTLVPPDDGERPKNADYVFQSDNAISELKSLQQEVFTRAYRMKLDELAQSWIKRGLIYVFGQANLNLRTLPPACQNEWLRLLTLPLQTSVVSTAHRQIRQTRKTLEDPVSTVLPFNKSRNHKRLDTERIWPDYERSVRDAPPSKEGQAPDRSMADFFWCVMAARHGHGIEDVAAKLLEVSAKAQERAPSRRRLCAHHRAECRRSGRAGTQTGQG